MLLTIDIHQPDKLQQVLALLVKLELDFRAVERPVRARKSTKKQLPIIEGDHSIDPYALAGIWEDYPITLDEIREKAWRTGPTPGEYKAVKSLNKRNLRDHMTNLEMIFTKLGEATFPLAVQDDAQGFDDNRKAAKKGGKSTGRSRANPEKI